MVVTYYIKLLADRQERLLMSLLLLVAEANIFIYSQFAYNLFYLSLAHILHCDNKELIVNYKCNFFSSLIFKTVLRMNLKKGLFLNTDIYNSILLNCPLDKVYFVSETFWICFYNFSGYKALCNKPT